MPQIEVIRAVAGRPWLAARTRRSLAEAGVEAAASGGTLFVAAGTWLRHPRQFRLPEAGAATPPVALGLPPPDDAVSRPWAEAQARCGGNFPDRSALPEPFCEWHPHGRAGDGWDNECPTQPKRAVHWPPLDWRHDPGLRILEVVTSLHHGGAEKIAWTLARSLPATGTACRLVVLGKPLRSTLPEPPGTVDLSDLPAGRRIEAVGRVAAAFGADVIHAHLLAADDLRQLTALGWPVMASVHNTRDGWMDGMETLRPGDVALLAACARAVGEEARLHLPDLPVRVVWNGIESRLVRATPPAGDGPHLLCVANPRPQKRLPLLPAILAATRRELRRRGRPDDARLVVAGELPARGNGAQDCYEAFRAAVAREGMEHAIRFTHGAEDVAELLARSQALVSCSAHEGLSLAHLEALAAGLPVVAADAGGTRELAWRNPALRLVSPQAGPEEYACVLADVLENPPDGGPAAVARHFSADTMARRVAWLARSLVSVRPAPEGPVWFVTNNLATGGAQSSLRRLLKSLHARGFPVRAAVLEEGPATPTPGRIDLEQAGIPVAAPPPVGWVGAQETVAALIEELAASPPRAVVFWNAMPPVKLLLADALVAVPVFDVSPGEMFFASLDRFFANPPPGLPYRNPRDYGELLAGFVVKYAGEAAQAAEVLGASVRVIPNGISIPETPVSLRSGDAPFVLGTAARLSPQKRLGDLLEAFRLALPRLPECVLRIAGEAEAGSDDHAAELRKSAQDLPVEWCGGITDLASFHASLDLFVMISEPAGCPNASLEAMAAGLPVIATDQGGASEQVIDEKSGLLVPPRDPAALAQAMVRMARDPELRFRLAEGARKHVGGKFSLARMTRDYVDLLEGAGGDRREAKSRD